MKKFITTSVFLLVMPFLACLNGEKNNNSNKRVEKHTYSIQNNIHEELIETFDDFQTIDNDNGVISYSFSRPLKHYSSVRLNALGEDEIDNYKLNFAIDSYDKVGFMDIQLNIVDIQTDELVFQDNVRGYEMADNQLCLEYKGNLYFAEEQFHEELTNFGNVFAGGTTIGHWGESGSVSDSGGVYHGGGSSSSSTTSTHPSPHVVVTDAGGSGGSSTPICDELMPDIVNVGLAICNETNAINVFKASQLMQIPTFNIANPFDYLYYDFVVKNATNHYSQNASTINGWKTKSDIGGKTVYENLILENEKDGKKFIVDQNNPNFADIKFGILQQNIKSSGCGLIAAYNSMIAAKTDPDLASMVMFFELCHADLIGGMFGVMPLNGTSVDVLSTAINTIYFTTLLPIMSATLEGLKWTAVAAEVNPILMIFFPGLAVTAAATTIAAFDTVHAAIILASAVMPLAEWYLKITPTEGEILKIIYGPTGIIEYDITNSVNAWETFRLAFKNKRRGIICSWNECTSDGLPSGSAHYYYITKEEDPTDSTKVQYLTKNGYNDGKAHTNTDLLDVLTYNGVPGRTCQFIWGCLFV